MHIYLITNLINDKKYIGQTIRKPKYRWAEHITNTLNPVMTVSYAMSKYGVENFIFEVIDECSSHDELNEAESYWIDFHNTFNGHGYNMTSGGNLNTIVSEQTKIKLSKKTSGKNNGMYGKAHTDETKKKISDKNKGRVHSCETRKKLSDRMIGNKHHMYGKHHSEETKRKISESQKGEKGNFYGRTHTDETKNKMSMSNRMKGKTGIQHNCSKVVIQINKITNEELTCWFSISDVHRELGIDQSSISRVCRGKQTLAGGFIWEYVNY